MKIMVIVKNLNGGGAERVAANLASCLSEYEKTILVVINADNAIYETTTEMINLKMPLNKGKIKFLWHLKLAAKVRNLKKKYKITHTISFMAEADLANILSKKSDKTVVSVRNKWSTYTPKGLRHYKNRWVFHKADKIVSLSQMVGYDLIKFYGVDRENIVTIYNPCYKENIKQNILNGVISEEERKVFEKYKGKIVITAGRLEPQKGQWHLIRAFSEVVKKYSDAKLIILGRGNEKDYLKELIKGFRLEHSVFLWGQKSNPYIYLANSDLFVFSSIYEGLGNILIECMACGLPVISTDCAFGPKELLAPEEDLFSTVEKSTKGMYGVLVPPMDGKKYNSKASLTNSEQILADTICELLENDSLRLNYKNKIYLRGNDFSPENITQQWLQLLANM